MGRGWRHARWEKKDGRECRKQIGPVLYAPWYVVGKRKVKEIKRRLGEEELAKFHEKGEKERENEAIRDLGNTRLYSLSNIWNTYASVKRRAEEESLSPISPWREIRAGLGQKSHLILHKVCRPVLRDCINIPIRGVAITRRNEKNQELGQFGLFESRIRHRDAKTEKKRK